MSKLFSGLALSLAGTLAATSRSPPWPEVRPRPRRRSSAGAPSLSNFGYRADVYGVKLVTDNVEAFNLKDAHAQLRCTRAIGADRRADVGPQRPGQPADQHRREHQPHRHLQGGRRPTASAGSTPIGDIRIGGEIAGVKTPTPGDRGPDHERQRLPHAAGLRPPGGVRLRQHQARAARGHPPRRARRSRPCSRPLDQVTDTVFEGTDEVANEIFKVLQSATAPIQIPGLGSIALGKVRGTANAKKATSEAMALEILVDAGGSRQLVEIGSANARIGAPAPAGVFRAGGTALDLQALQSSLRFGNVQHKSIPCEGTLGKTKTYQRPLRGRPARARGPGHRRHLLPPRQPAREEEPRQGLQLGAHRQHVGAGGRPRDQRHRQLGQDARQGEQAGQVDGHLEHRLDHLPGPACRRTRAGPDGGAARRCGTDPATARQGQPVRRQVDRPAGPAVRRTRSCSTSAWPTGTSTRAETGSGQQPFNVASAPRGRTRAAGPAPRRGRPRSGRPSHRCDRRSRRS